MAVILSEAMDRPVQGEAKDQGSSFSARSPSQTDEMLRSAQHDSHLFDAIHNFSSEFSGRGYHRNRALEDGP